MPTERARHFYGQVVSLTERFPFGRINVSLTENAPEGADRNLVLLRNDRGIDDDAAASYKLDMAALLACFDETGSLESTFDFPERQRIKPRQPRPR